MTDIAPTFHYLVDSRVPAHMSGKVALELLDPRMAAQRQVNRFMDLAKFPRVALAHLPTPPESMKRLLLTDPQAVYLGGREWT